MGAYLKEITLREDYQIKNTVGFALENQNDGEDIVQ